MTNVGQVGINSTTIGTNFNRAGFFESAVSQQGGWRGGAKQENSSGLWINNMPGKKADEKAVQAEEAKQQKPDSKKMRQFFASNNAYFPPVDYYANQRENSLFESIKGRAGFSPTPWTASLPA
jgi:hypothetical protein